MRRNPSLNSKTGCLKIVDTLRQVRKGPGHPKVKRVVQEEISQDWADDSSLWSAARSLNQGSFLLQHWGSQPSFDVEQRPRARDVFSDGPHQQRVVDIVERRHDRLPITKTIRIRSSSLVNGMYLKGGGSLSSGASQDGVFLSFL